MLETNPIMETKPKRKAGRPRKTELKVVDSNVVEMENLRSKCQQLEKENSDLKKIANMISITSQYKLFECSDDEINLLYIKYLTESQTVLNNARLIKTEN